MADIEEDVKGISAQEFKKLDRDKVTIVDLREPDEVLIHEIEGAINIPFSRIWTKIDTIPKDKPVYVICSTGDVSAEIAEILQEREYEVYNVEGGFRAYRKSLDSGEKDRDTGTNEKQDKAKDEASVQDDIVYIDAKNLRCPGPIVKVADTIRGLESGQTVEVEATEDAFLSDIKVWCERTGNSLDDIRTEGDLIKARITKKDTRSESVANGGTSPDPDNDKTFVVFSGDLDKTIAAFIMANGAAAMGRNVTMFFTFWGLNILRRPQKIRVKKSLIEKMFGFMMPRGTTKLGLSRMNMFGMGPKMIRGIMKKKGIASLEELIEDAKAHGVRLVACQMSMDIMGITKEELIDGVELGGVATFIGSGEKSDMSLFI